MFLGLDEDIEGPSDVTWKPKSQGASPEGIAGRVRPSAHNAFKRHPGELLQIKPDQ
jgi:hypothetical protein